MKYVWNEGYFAKVDAETAGQICEELMRDGRLNAQELINISRNQDSPMHNCFLWDNRKASEKWRCQQAKVLISALRVITDEDKTPRKQFYNLSKNYESVDVLLAFDRESLLQAARKDFEIFAKKYESLAEWAEVIEEGRKL